MIFLQPLKKYAVFSGRASRVEFWSYLFFLFLMGMGACWVDIYTGGVDVETGKSWWLDIVSLATLLPTVAVSVRRLHDTDRSGWWCLIGLTGIGNLLLVIFFCLSGSSRENRFGAGS